MSGRLVVVGSGAFGTALGVVACLAGQQDAVLLCRTRELADKINRAGENRRSLSGVSLPSALCASAEPEMLREADTVLFAMPSQAHRQAARSHAGLLGPGASIVSCAKGIEQATGALMTDILEQELPGHPVSVLSGPGFAADIGRGLPTAMVIASPAIEEAERLAHLFSGRTFRLYPSTDRIGVQIGGALKNVLAIAAGMVEGAGLGESARAALIARGLAEMSRLVHALGGRGETVMGLSGLGDLVLTATSHQSRNQRFGAEIGRKGSLARTGELVEGAFAASIAARMAAENGVDMPVTDAVAAIIDGRLDVATAMSLLMSRPLTTESGRADAGPAA